jgi:L-2-hydroxyglutarate oxidase LhgO
MPYDSGMDLDVAVIGAGAVGLACAMELARTKRVAVIERHGALAMETTSHNSGVIHAGIYYPTASLKHTLCIEGNALLYEWCATRNVRAHRLGKLVVAVDDGELGALDAVHARAVANGVCDIEMIGEPAKLRGLEPEVRCVAGMWSGTTGVIDQAAFAASLAGEVERNGGIIALKHELLGIERAGGGFALRMRDPDAADASLTCETLVNSAGLGAPAVASMLGYPLDGTEGVPVLRQYVNKGRYYDIVTPAKARALRHLVYPVPEHTKGGLGVHVTLDVDGGAHLGPDTEWLDDSVALDYRADDLRRADFHAAASRYLPFLEPEDLAPGQVGYRPKLQAPGGEPADFLIWHDRGYMHLGGIESPGLTASLAIARRVATLIAGGAS